MRQDQMRIFIGLSEIVLGITYLILIWKRRHNLVDYYFYIGDIQANFMNAHFNRVGKWWERARESQANRYLREHPRPLQYIWTVGSLAFIALGIGSILNFWEYRLLEIIIPIGGFIGVILMLWVGKNRTAY
jgi:hypothetical protein